MSQRFALFLSALITVILIGGIAIVNLGVQALAEISAPEASAPVALSAEPVAEVATLVPMATEPVAVATSTAAPIATATATATYAVSAEQAATIALNTAPGAALASPAELVDFQGAVAYEVGLDAGKVYIDANSGQVLYSSVTAALPEGPVNQDQAVQIATAYMQEVGNPSEAVDVREGRSRRLRGMTLFEVTFADETRVYVNADTGEIAQVNAGQNRENHEDQEGDDD